MVYTKIALEILTFLRSSALKINLPKNRRYLDWFQAMDLFFVSPFNRLEYQSMREPFEDEKNLCNTLISYLQRYSVDKEDLTMLPSPREEQPGTPFGSSK